MPVRSLSSRVLKWPDARAVDRALREAAKQVAAAHPEVLRIGYFGSYARGDWGVGSDLDVLVIVSESSASIDQRGRDIFMRGVPVPMDLLIYTWDEWARLQEESNFARTVSAEVRWVRDFDDS